MFDTALQQGSRWQSAHEALTRLARARAGLDFEEGEKLRVAVRARVHERLGYGSFVEYIERLFGYSPRLTLQKLRVAEALDGLPQLAAALREGNVSWSSVRELTRVATHATERDWLEASRGRTVREVEKLVSGHRPGDLPGETKGWRAERHVLRFEVSGEVLASFREAQAKLRRDAGGPLDDDTTLLLMARHVLGGPTDDGRASYQIALAVCPSCGSGQQRAGGELVPVAAEVVAMAQCDGQHLGCVPSRAANENGIVGDAHVDAVVPRPDAHAIPRAKQPVPPALRRAAVLRDQHRCRVPGCRNAIFLDLHHVELRSEGGRNQLANLVTVCGAHHRAAHRGHLIIEGDAHMGVRFRHADGTEYGQTLQPQALDVSAKLFSALRGLGFREREVRAVLAELRKDEDLRNASIEHLLRESLRRIQLSGVRR